MRRPIVDDKFVANPQPRPFIALDREDVFFAVVGTDLTGPSYIDLIHGDRGMGLPGAPIKVNHRINAYRMAPEGIAVFAPQSRRTGIELRGWNYLANLRCTRPLELDFRTAELFVIVEANVVLLP